MGLIWQNTLKSLTILITFQEHLYWSHCWKILNSQHQHNKCTTTPHMRVSSTHWGPPSCEGLLCTCCDGVVQESNPLIIIDPSATSYLVVAFRRMVSSGFYSFVLHVFPPRWMEGKSVGVNCPRLSLQKFLVDSWFALNPLNFWSDKRG
jgi:hypothetical protein